MAYDWLSKHWKAEWNLTWRIWKWWMITGLLAIPFGTIYAFTVRALHHESGLALGICAASALVADFIIQGLPPMK